MHLHLLGLHRIDYLTITYCIDRTWQQGAAKIAPASARQAVKLDKLVKHLIKIACCYNSSYCKV